jgi:hypothetical protein
MRFIGTSAILEENYFPGMQHTPMTTKPPSKVHLAPDNSTEKIAYASVAGIPAVEPNDQVRLGYSIWLWLTHRRDPLEVAVKTAGARLLISEEEAMQRIRQSLQAQGIEV